MRSGEARLLLHRGHGALHLDLVLGGGARLPTVRLERGGHGWSASWLAPHRRRYLTWSGPVGGRRGTVVGIWRGRAAWWRTDGGWRFRLEDGTTITMRDGRAHIGGGVRRLHG